MSQLKVNTIRHTGASSDAVTLASDGTCTAKVTNNLSNRNLIINGSYQINQRGNQTGIGGSSVYTLDRWMHGRENGSNSTRWDISQTALAKTDLPYTAGHRNCMKLDCTTASSNSGTNDTAYITQRIEGFNCSHLDWGNSGAKTLTLSFYAKTDGSTGVMCVSAYATKSYVKEVTLSNSWQKFTVEIAGNTADEIANSNASGLQLMFVLHSGSDHEISAGSWSAGFDCATSNQVNFGSSTDNNIYITGVQLEVGDVATDFEHRTFADELLRCQRYYWKSYDYSVVPGTASDPGSIFGRNYHTTSKSQNPLDVRFPVPMRAIPTTVNGYAVHSGTIAKVSTDASNAVSCDVENTINDINMLGERGFSSISTASIPGTDFFGAHFTADAEL